MKKIYQSGWDRINEMARERAKQYENTQDKHKIFYKLSRIVIFGLITMLLLPLFLSEEIIANCGLCQEFISFMSSIVLGIKVMSHASVIPQMVSLEVSLAWIVIPIFICLMLYSAIFVSNYFDSTMYGSGWFFLFMYIGLVFFLTGEIGLIKSNVSFFHGTIGLLHEGSRHNLPHHLIQSRIGLGFFIFMATFFELTLIFSFVVMNISLIVNFFKRIFR